jgi:hypothetical protein
MASENGDTAAAGEPLRGEVGPVEDPEEFIEERRLRDIFEARDRLRERRITVKTAPDHKEYRAVSAYRSAVSNYLMEVEPLLARYEDGEALLFDVEFGCLRVEPDVEFTEWPAGANTWTVEVDSGSEVEIEREQAEQADTRVFAMEGLVSLFNYPDPLLAQWEFEQTYRGGEQVKYTHTKEAQIRFGVLDRMARSINRFLADIGFELEPESDDTWEVDV